MAIVQHVPMTPSAFLLPCFVNQRRRELTDGSRDYTAGPAVLICTSNVLLRDQTKAVHTALGVPGEIFASVLAASECHSRNCMLAMGTMSDVIQQVRLLKLRLSNIKCMIMLDFNEIVSDHSADIFELASRMEKKCQVILLSTRMSTEMASLAKRLIEKPERIEFSGLAENLRVASKSDMHESSAPAESNMLQTPASIVLKISLATLLSNVPQVIDNDTVRSNSSASLSLFGNALQIAQTEPVFGTAASPKDSQDNIARSVHLKWFVPENLIRDVARAANIDCISVKTNRSKDWAIIELANKQIAEKFVALAPTSWRSSMNSREADLNIQEGRRSSNIARQNSFEDDDVEPSGRNTSASGRCVGSINVLTIAELFAVRGSTKPGDAKAVRRARDTQAQADESEWYDSGWQSGPHQVHRHFHHQCGDPSNCDCHPANGSTHDGWNAHGWQSHGDNGDDHDEAEWEDHEWQGGTWQGDDPADR